ncbi:DUF420 domain-containing protein [uncultured Microscilla sp.]|uniref:DUF420 domain-containing protein n=1 Tax=uncultured Microscilla sp. TaxID=432653 RepID=UPI00262537B9|nr:DUF420 domain-containing protein [uncultured Microscilla sp.]
MTNALIAEKNKRFMPVIWTVSILIPLVVAVLFYLQRKMGGLGNLNVSFLPHLNAILNSATFICLIGGFVSIKNKKEQYHRVFMMTAFVLSSLFLVSYVIYHSQGHEVPFGGQGTIRYFYFVILITHIGLSLFVVPLALFAIYFAITKQIDRHKKIVRWTFPVWVYVAFTGVLVYLMISPYYPA